MIKDKKKAFKIFTLVNLISFCIYLLLGQVIKRFNLEFIDVVNTIVAVNIITILSWSVHWVESKWKYRYKKTIVAILIIIVIVASLFIYIIRIFTYKTEHIVYKNGKIIVITVSSFLTNTCVTIYESKFLILKNEIGDGGTFDGAYDPFERGEVEY